MEIEKAMIISIFNAIIENESIREKEVQLSLVRALNSMRREMEMIYDNYAHTRILGAKEKAKYEHLDSITQQIQVLILPGLEQYLLNTRGFSPQQYQELFYNGVSTPGIRAGAVMVAKEVLIELSSITDEKNEFMNDALRNYSIETRKKIQKVLFDGIVRGNPIEYMAKDMQKTIDISRKEALQLVRTESMAALTHGAYDSYIKAMQMGVKGRIVWDAVKDLETRPSHRAMDGQSPREDGFFHLPDGQITPFPHWEGLSEAERINCRCCLNFIVDGHAPTFMRTREFGIEPYLPYNEWYKRHYGEQEIESKADEKKHKLHKKSD